MTTKKRVLTDKDSPEGFKPKRAPAPPPATESAALKKKNDERWEAAKQSAKQRPAPAPEPPSPERVYDTQPHSEIVAKITRARARNAAARKLRDDANANLPSMSARVKQIVAAQNAKNAKPQGDTSDGQENKT